MENNKHFIIENGILEKYIGPGGDVVIPEGVAKIKDRAFYGCTSMTSVTIPEGVTEIGYDTFQDCTGLTSITIPKGITEIRCSTFAGCKNLTSVTIPESVTEIWYGAFSGCKSLTSVTIPKSIKYIGNLAFDGCTGLTSITIPEGVREIGRNAFYGCKALTSVTIPKSITEIGDSIFYGCTALTSVTIPEGITKIWRSAFEGCTGLTEILVDTKNPVYRSSNGMLVEKHSLTVCPLGKTGDVTIPDGVTTIAHHAFQNCRGLTSITIPEGITEIGEGAFSGCTGLTEILVDTKNPVYRSNNGMLVEKDSLTLCPLGRIGDVTIAEGVTTIRNSAFQGCTGLTSVSIPASVTRIGNRAFEGCSRLTNFAVADDSKYYISIDGVLMNKKRTILYRCPAAKNGILTIPAGIKKIRHNACSNCTKLTGIVIPNSVTEIGSGAFSNCSSLTSLTFPSGVQEISSNVLSGCSALTELTLPKNAHSIGCRAFSGCRSLKNLKIPDGVTQIGGYAFLLCTALESLTLPESLRTFEQAPMEWNVFKPFDGCRNLKCVTFPAQVERLPRNLSSNSAIEKVALLGATTKVHKTAFMSGSKSDVNVCIFAPNMELSNLPTELRMQAVKGFAVHFCAGEDLPEAYRANYLKYMRRQRKRLIPLAVECESVLRVMITEKLLSNQDIPLLLDECDKQHNITARAAVLEYQS